MGDILRWCFRSEVGQIFSFQERAFPENINRTDLSESFIIDSQGHTSKHYI